MEETFRDTELLERLRASDREALGVLFDRYQPALFRQILFQTGQPEMAHDIVQEAFLRTWEHRSSIRPELSFFGYLLRISRNILLDDVRYRKVREKHEGAVPLPEPSEGDNPEESAQLSMLQEALVKVVYQDLAERCRTIFVLSRFEGRSNKEIATQLGLSVRTVENQMNHALKVLRRELESFL